MVSLYAMKDYREIVHYVANLARIELTAEEEELFAPQFQKIIGYIDTLNTLDTIDIDPTFNIIALKNVLREDIPQKNEAYQKIISNFPQKDGNYCVVPKVID